jgi:hypothetical protein
MGPFKIINYLHIRLTKLSKKEAIYNNSYTTITDLSDCIITVINRNNKFQEKAVYIRNNLMKTLHRIRGYLPWLNNKLRRHCCH